MSALLWGIDQITKAALSDHKASGMPDTEISDILLIMNGFKTFTGEGRIVF